MADNTPIEWTDATWNPITGCAVVSPGCTNCYAMQLAGTRLKNHESRRGLTKAGKAGPVWTGEVRLNRQWLHQPLEWKRPRMIFVCAHGDLFAEGVPDEWIDQVFAVMALSPQHTFQVLTKRPERMRGYLYGDSARQRIAWAEGAKIMNKHAPQWRKEDIFGPNRSLVIAAGTEWPLPNVWLGVSVEDQRRADERIEILRQTPAALRWISAEPMLSEIKMSGVSEDRQRTWDWLTGMTGIMHREDGPDFDYGPKIDWVVAGGESGPHARPMHPEWVRSLRDQCAAAGTPFLFKQWGEWVSTYDRDRDDPDWRHVPKAGDWNKKRFLNLAGGQGFHGDKLHLMRRVGKRAAGRHLDGVLHDAFPQVSR